jgi:phage shock protein A
VTVDSADLQLCRELCESKISNVETKITNVDKRLQEIHLNQQGMAENQNKMLEKLTKIETKINSLNGIKEKVDRHETYFQIIGGTIALLGAKVVGLIKIG